MLKVLHLNTEKTWRGGERQLWLQFRYATKTEQYLACRKSSAVFTRIGPFAKAAFELPMRSGVNPLTALRLVLICRKHHISIIHAHSPKALTIAFIASFFLKVKIVTTKRTSFPIRQNWLTLAKYKACALVICVSEAARRVLAEGLPGVNHTVIPSAIEAIPKQVDFKVPSALTGHSEKLKVGYVAALSKEKNATTFLAVAEAVTKKKKDVLFLWVGDGDMMADVKLEVESRGLENKVLLPGFQSNIHEWMYSLDILFFPSFSEGFPTTILDSFQLGVPVIASNVGGIPEIISDGENGLLSDPEDTSTFIKGILQLIDDPALLNKIRKNAMRSCEPHLAENRIPQLESLYEKLT